MQGGLIASSAARLLAFSALALASAAEAARRSHDYDALGRLTATTAAARSQCTDEQALPTTGGQSLAYNVTGVPVHRHLRHPAAASSAAAATTSATSASAASAAPRPAASVISPRRRQRLGVRQSLQHVIKNVWRTIPTLRAIIRSRSESASLLRTARHQPRWRAAPASFNANNSSGSAVVTTWWGTASCQFHGTLTVKIIATGHC